MKAAATADRRTSRPHPHGFAESMAQHVIMIRDRHAVESFYLATGVAAGRLLLNAASRADRIIEFYDAEFSSV
jgi:hypothetical protein